jgi:hypothetical protein
MYEVIGKSFDTEKEYLDFISKNEPLIFDTKKSEMKKADGFGFDSVFLKKDLANKGTGDSTPTEIFVKIAINTSNILDSHKDVHIPGLWDKSLKERGKNVMHLQEHVRKYSHVIARGEDLKAYAETVTWKSLGYDMEGKTNVLTFDSLVKDSQNSAMFKEYMKGNVTEHSVGMQYVKMVTCINDEDYPVQKENWDKYAPMVANTDTLKQTKVFWAVTEAKAIEGSSVLMGSNSFTPTVSATPKNIEPTKDELKINAIKEWLTK